MPPSCRRIARPCSRARIWKCYAMGPRLKSAVSKEYESLSKRVTKNSEGVLVRSILEAQIIQRRHRHGVMLCKSRIARAGRGVLVLQAATGRLRPVHGQPMPCWQFAIPAPCTSPETRLRGWWSQRSAAQPSDRQPPRQ
eukprot:366466-Chlamydomonas_euryale.AAC.12